MKYHILTICLAVIIVSFGNCKKDIGNVEINVDSLVGSWELRQAQRGMIPTKEYAPKNGNIYKFTNSQYEKYTDGNLVQTGKYQLIRDDSVEKEVGLDVPDGQFTTRIIFDNDSVYNKTFIEITGNKLTMLSGYFPLDGGSRLVFEK